MRPSFLRAPDFQNVWLIKMQCCLLSCTFWLVECTERRCSGESQKMTRPIINSFRTFQDPIFYKTITGRELFSNGILKQLQHWKTFRPFKSKFSIYYQFLSIVASSDAPCHVASKGIHLKDNKVVEFFLPMCKKIPAHKDWICLAD